MTSIFISIFMIICSRFQITRENRQTRSRNAEPENKWWVLRITWITLAVHLDAACISGLVYFFLSCNPVFRPVRSLLLDQGEWKTKSQKKTWNTATWCLKTTPPALWYSLSKIALAQNGKGLSSSFYFRRQRKGDKVGKQSSMLSRWRGQTDYTALWLTLLGACWVSLAGFLPGEMTPHVVAFCSVGWFKVVVSPGHLSVSHTEPRPR